MKIEVLYQDEYIVIVNKPNNILMYPSYYARNIKDLTLVELVNEQLKSKIFPLHRLDRKTSGVVVLGKTKEAAQEFETLFSNQKVEKKYYAIVRGYCYENGEINNPIKNEKGKYKEALTIYKTLKTYEWKKAVTPYPASRYSLLELHPKTGRMHQLRKHLNKINHPIIGDHKYGDRNYNKLFTNEFNIDNLYLHANSICFKHPLLNNQEISISASIPTFWDKVISKFNWD